MNVEVALNPTIPELAFFWFFTRNNKLVFHWTSQTITEVANTKTLMIKNWAGVNLHNETNNSKPFYDYHKH